jgi:hypothetical protein
VGMDRGDVYTGQAEPITATAAHKPADASDAPMYS